VHHREESSLEPTDKEAISSELGISIDSELQEREDAPCNVKEGNQIVDRNVGEKKEEWDLSGDGTDDVEGLQLDELVAFEVEVFLESGDICIVCTEKRLSANRRFWLHFTSVLTQVGLVNVLDPVRQDGVWDNEKVNLRNVLSLLFGVRVGVPLDLPPGSAFMQSHIGAMFRSLAYGLE
jgi:hypothetical protein